MKKQLFLATPVWVIYLAIQLKAGKLIAQNIQSVL